MLNYPNRLAALVGAGLFVAGPLSAQVVPAPAVAPGTNLIPADNVFSRYLSPYEPIYFILGTYPAAEFQFSLKFQVSGITNGWASATTNIYLAYTQTSFWDLISSDPSFFDTSYKPSAFYRLSNVLKSSGDDLVRLDLQSGLEHESNGRGGSAERSMYRTYLSPTLTLGHADGFQFALEPRAWFYTIGLSANNPNMADYKGYADIKGTLSWRAKDADPSQTYKLTTYFDLGDHGGYSAWKFDLSFSLSQWLPWFTPRIHAQYFTGYGQTMRQYNRYSSGLRAGISLYD